MWHAYTLHHLSDLWPLGQKSLSLGAAMKIQRGTRQKHNPIVLTKRDVQMLLALGIFRYASARQIQEQFFQSYETCRRRLRKLFNAGFIRVLMYDSKAANLVALTSKGRRAVLTAYPEYETRLHLAGVINLIGVPHHLAVLDSRCYLVRLCQRQEIQLLRWSYSGGDIGKDLELDNYSLKPDGLAELKTKDHLIYLALEIDMGTESQKILSTKLDKYKQAFSDERLTELWWIIKAGARRESILIRSIEQAGLSRQSRIMNQTFIRTRPVQKPMPVVSNSISDKNP